MPSDHLGMILSWTLDLLLLTMPSFWTIFCPICASWFPWLIYKNMGFCYEMPKLFQLGLDLHSLHRSLNLCRISLFVCLKLSVSCLGASERIKIPPSDATKPIKQVGSSTSPDLSGSRSSVCSDTSNHSPSDIRATGSATDHPANETHGPLVNGPLVFHNSKISSQDPTPVAASTGRASAEVLLVSQIQGSSSYLVPAVLPSGYPVFPPSGLTVSGAASAPWLAATSLAANQVCYNFR